MAAWALLCETSKSMKAVELAVALTLSGPRIFGPRILEMSHIEQTSDFAEANIIAAEG
jgi:hypothetical protein